MAAAPSLVPRAKIGQMSRVPVARVGIFGHVPLIPAWAAGTGVC